MSSDDDSSTSVSSTTSELGIDHIEQKRYRRLPKRGKNVGGQSVGICSDAICFNNLLKTIYLKIPKKYKVFTIEALLMDFRDEIIQIIRNEIINDNLNNFGLYINIGIKLIKNIVGQNETVEFMYLNTPRYVLVLQEIEEVYDIFVDYILEHFEKYFDNVEGSGMIMDSISEMSFSYHKILLQSNVRGYVKWPTKKCSKLVFNPTDGNCLIKCVAAGVRQEQLLKDKMKLDWSNIKRQFKDLKGCQKILNISNISNPIDLENINMLERNNKVKINIYRLNKYVYEGDSYDFNIDLYFKSKYSSRRKFKKNNIILYSENNQTHAFLMKCSFKRFLSRFAETKLKENEELCPYCFLKIDNKIKYIHHKHNYCSTVYSNVEIQYPDPGTKRKFINYARCQMYRYLQFFDFESILKDSNNEKIHHPISFSEITVDTKTHKIISNKSYLGEDCVNVYLEHTLNIWRDIYDNKYPLNMTKYDEMNFQNSTYCMICERTFDQNIIKQRHHDHYEKKNNYIGSLCQRCNLSIKKQNKLISVAHNASYDIGLILKFCTPKYSFQTLPKKSHLKFYNVLVNNKIKIIDSLNFLRESLQKLVEDHVKSGLSLDFTTKALSHKGILPNTELYNLLISGKPAMCYDYISNINKLSETKLPEKCHFFNRLRNSEISDEDYKAGVRIYELKKCENIGDYLILYNAMDVYLLCDIFITWRKTFFDMYRLDIAQYLTISAYSFDACLFLNKDNLEIDLLSDPELIGIINYNIRGGYCCLNKKYGKFDNFFTVKDKNERNKLEKNTYCFYLDVNSLYSKAMSENLPYKNIEECSIDEYLEVFRKMCDSDFDPKNSDVGYWLLVDFKKNNDELQSITDQYPLAFENVTITNKHLSPYTKMLLQNDGKKYKFQRLIGHHDTKENYLVTGENFHLYLQMGMEVEKIHRIFKFQQKPLLKEYIDSNIEKRKNANNNLESHLYKLLNNSVFGKLMSSSLNYGYKTNICTDKTKFNKLIKSEKFKQCHILSNDKVIVISEKNQ